MESQSIIYLTLSLIALIMIAVSYVTGKSKPVKHL
jgi:hypothetical protein